MRSTTARGSRARRAPSAEARRRSVVAPAPRDRRSDTRRSSEEDVTRGPARRLDEQRRARVDEAYRETQPSSRPSRHPRRNMPYAHAERAPRAWIARVESGFPNLTVAHRATLSGRDVSYMTARAGSSAPGDTQVRAPLKLAAPRTSRLAPRACRPTHRSPRGAIGWSLARGTHDYALAREPFTSPRARRCRLRATR